MRERFVRFTPRHHGKGPNGRRLCVWCGTEVPVGRRKWCSDECVKQMQIQHWPQVWGKEVINRDKGVCRICGFDSRLTKRVIDRLRWDHATDSYPNHDRHEAWKLVKDNLFRLGFNQSTSLVEADHIVPIVEGGENTLDNGRCLCVPCHKAETAGLANRRKWDRRAQKRGLLFHMGKDPA